MIYELLVKARRRPYFMPHDLRYFSDHFVCKAMASDWSPPPAEILGKSYKSADFLLWMLSAPVVSARAREALSRFADLLEFLPFHAVRGSPYFAMNVLSTDPSSPVHKTHPTSLIFVNDEFGSVLRDEGLSGVELADVNANNARKALRGEPVNIFPGLIG